LQTEEAVTPDEIRALDTQDIVLREAAAQLAEHTVIMRHNADRADRAEERLQKLIADAPKLFADMMAATQQSSPVPVFRVPPAGPMPEHLCCFVLMPDGSYGIAIEGGIVPVEPEEAQRIIAVLSKPAEGKPQ
jgi:hypothetical protein